VILAASIGAVLVLVALDSFRQHGRISQPEGDLLLALSGVAVGAVAVYIGGRGNGH
jgi:hypothetical protein